MPISKKITATRVVNAFSGTPDGTLFLRDDGTLATAGSSYAKLVESGADGGTLTLFDDTATIGASTLQLRIGAGQSASATWYPLLQVLNNAGSAILGYPLVSTLTGAEVQVCATTFRHTNNSFILGTISELASTHELLWSSGASYDVKDSGLARDGVGILRVSNGSTGQGGIGISDAVTNAVTDALILRHATSGTATTGFGTGLLFQGEDAAGNMQSMASIQAVYTDATNGSEDADLVAYGTVGGTLTKGWTISPSIAGVGPTLLANGIANLQSASSYMVLQVAADQPIYLGNASEGFKWMLDGTTDAWRPYVDNACDIGSTSAVVRKIYTAGIEVYDDTATTGASYINIRQGDVQAGAGPYPLSVYQNDGTTMDFAVSPELNTGWTGIRSLRYIGNTDSNFLLDPNVGLAFRNAGGTATQGINWNDTTYAAYDLQLLRHAANVAIFTNGSTGIGSILSSRYVQAKAANYTLAVTDSNSVFTNEGTTTKNNFSLPTAAANLVYTFVVQDTDGLTVTANTGDTIQDNATVSASAGTIDSTDVGATVTLIAINATQWVVTSMTGTWAIT